MWVPETPSSHIRGSAKAVGETLTIVLGYLPTCRWFIVHGSRLAKYIHLLLVTIDVSGFTAPGLQNTYTYC